jgi:hypothetical protein
MWTALIASLLAITLKMMMRSENDNINSIGSILSVTIFSIAIIVAITHFASN